MTPCVFSDQLHGGSPIRRRLRSIHGQQVQLITYPEGAVNASPTLGQVGRDRFCSQSCDDQAAVDAQLVKADDVDIS